MNLTNRTNGLIEHADLAWIAAGPDGLFGSVEIRASGDWIYDMASNRYRNTKTGRYMTATDQLALRDAVTDRYKGKMIATAGRLNDGEISVTEWRASFARQMKSTYLQQYAFGRGGMAQLTDADRAELAAIIDRQNRYLDRFAEQIRDGDVSAAQILNRSGMYADGATAAYESGLVASFTDAKPPAVPGDGSTECGSRCRCSLDLSRTDEGIAVTWRLAPRAEHCDDCRARASSWSPLILTATPAGDESTD